MTVPAEHRTPLDLELWLNVEVEVVGGFHDGYTDYHLVPPNTVGFSAYLQVLQDEFRGFGEVTFDGRKILIRHHSLCR